MNIEETLCEMLLPVLGYECIDDISLSHSLVKDLGADSIDFVEIIYLIEQNFGVILKTNELLVAGINSNELFFENRLSRHGAELIKNHLGETDSRYKEGMTKVELFSVITVKDLAKVIELKIKEKNLCA